MVIGHFKKWFWILAMLLMTAGLCYNLKGLTMNYLSHQVDVAITLVYQQQVVFPAVTICNLNPVRKSALEAALSKGVIDLDKPKSTRDVKSERRRKRQTGGEHFY